MFCFPVAKNGNLFDQVQHHIVFFYVLGGFQIAVPLYYGIKAKGALKNTYHSIPFNKIPWFNYKNWFNRVPLTSPGNIHIPNFWNSPILSFFLPWNDLTVMAVLIVYPTKGKIATFPSSFATKFILRFYILCHRKLLDVLLSTNKI